MITEEHYQKIEAGSIKAQVSITRPQLRLLVEICEQPRHVVEYYPPARKLIQHGLAQFFANGILRPTESGARLIGSLEETVSLLDPK